VIQNVSIKKAAPELELLNRNLSQEQRWIRAPTGEGGIIVAEDLHKIEDALFVYVSPTLR